MLRFGAGIGIANIQIKVSPNNTTDGQVYINGNLSLIVENMFTASGTIETFQFADGSTLATASLYTAVNGTTGNDVMVGADRPYFLTDVLNGDKGDDRLSGGAGDDRLFGGLGNDTYVISSGNDLISDTGGTDTIEFDGHFTQDGIVLARSDADLLITFQGARVAAVAGQFSGNAIERITFQAGGSIDLSTIHYQLTGTAKGESLYGINSGGGGDIIAGLGGNDAIFGYGGDDALDGGDGNDQLYGGAGDDRYILSAGTDVIREDGGTDTLYLGSIDPAQVSLVRVGYDLVVTAGNSTVVVDDQFYGDPIETLSFADGTTIDLLARRYVAVGDSTSERINGISSGGNPDDELHGGGGNDVIYGYGGNDILDGGTGNDELYGGVGGDSYYVGGSIAGPAAPPPQLIGNGFYISGQLDYISDDGNADDAPDTLYLPDGLTLADLSIVRRADGDLLILWNDSGVLIDRAYSKYYAIERLVLGGQTYDLLALPAATLGSSADDTLNGNTQDRGSRDDRLIGNAGDDTLNGYDGNDTLDGGDGDDALYGSTGGDTYLPGAGANYIADNGNAADAADRIILPTGIALADVTFVRLYDGDIELRWAGGSVRINNALDRDYAVETLQDATGATLSIPAHAVTTQGSALGETLSGNTEELGSRDDVIYGYAGDDTLNGYDGADTLYGGPGNDVLRGGSGADRYFVGEGDDVVYDDGNNGDAADAIYLAAGISPAGVTAFLASDGDIVLKWNGGSVRIDGAFNRYNAVEELHFASGEVWQLTARSYEMLSTAGNDSLYGNSRDLGSRNDVIRGLGGDDYLSGGDGNDTLDGGAGDDQMYGGSGADTYVVGYGWDYIQDSGNSGDGADIVRIDRAGITAGGLTFGKYASGDVRISWNGGADGVYVYRALSGSYTIETVQLQDGTSFSLAAQTFQTLVTASNLSINGDSGANTLTGGDGNDMISAGAGADTLDGGAGDDTLYGGTGADTYRVGIGHDRISDSGSAGEIDTIILTVPVAAAALRYTRGSDGSLLISWGSGDVRISDEFQTNYAVEKLVLTDNSVIDLLTVPFETTGTGGDDSLSGNGAPLGSQNDVIRGLEGNDQLYGNAGNDTLDGGTGDDRMEGGAGNDAYVVSGKDYIQESSGADRLFLPDGVTAADLTATRDGVGNLTIAWPAGSVMIYAGLDLAHAVETLVFADGSVASVAALRFETIGTAADDSLYGNAEELGSRADVMHGLDGDDRLFGYEGDDTLDGGAGDDQMFGAGGNDRYLVSGHDYVEDAGGTADTTDTIVLPAGLTAGDLSLTRDRNGNLTLSWQDGSVVIYAGLDQRYAVERIEFADGSSIATLSLPFVTRGDNGDNSIDGNRASVGSHDDVIRGLDGSDALYGYDGNDVLDGGANDDRLYGGTGNDLYIVGGGNNIVSESGSSGDSGDRIILPDGVLPTAVHAVRLGNGDIKISWAGGNVEIDNAYDPRSAIEQVSFGNGTVWTLADFVFVTEGTGENENLYGNTLGFGSHVDIIRAMDGSDTLYGQDGNDVLDGGGGDDRVYGGTGDDTYVASAGRDIFSETSGGGTDLIRFDADVHLSDLALSQSSDGSLQIDWRDGTIVIDRQMRGGTYAIESIEIGNGPLISLTGLANLSVSGAAATAPGDDGANILLGNGDANELLGKGGDDILMGGAGADRLSGDAGNDLVLGGKGDDVISVGPGRDLADGGDGSDILILSGVRASYDVVTAGGGTYLLGSDGTGVLASNIETVQFADGVAAWASLETGARPFDAFLYLASNADLALGIGLDTAAATRQFVGQGFLEGRVTTGFDPFEYLASNWDLALGYGSNVVAAEAHWIAHGIAEGRNTTSFDLIGYLAANPDLALAFGSNFQGAIRHWIDHGISEGRQTSGFDAIEYLASNPDLALGFGTNTYGATLHWIQHGVSEGRATTSFDALEYLASNKDLALGFGTNTDSATLHWIEHGVSEGRATTSFDVLDYLASNVDLALGFGTNSYSATLHWIEHGIAEGRATTSFDALRYLASNPDLTSGYGTNLKGVERHWIEHGISEGRSTTAFDPIQYLAANTDLILGFGHNVVGVEYHYIQHGLAEGRATSGFDTVAYELTYQDLAQAGMSPEWLLLHWVDHGAAEGRIGDMLYGREQTNHAASVGAAVSDKLDGAGDHDWFQLTLAAGQHIEVTLAGSGFAGAVAIADNHGVQLAQGAGGAIDFTADHAGLFYISAAAVDPHASGQYMLSIDQLG